MPRSLLLLISLVLAFQFTQAQPQLFESSQVSLLTVGSGQDLYSIFGHTAIRVKDPENQVDVVYNYGTFEFTEDFYFKFCMGKLNYKLSIEPYEYFHRGYVFENRWVEEQILDLNLNQRQKVFDALNLNYQPENRYYLYDFYYDNCSTRPRDILKSALGNDLSYDYRPELPDSTFRDMIDKYLPQQSWSDIGIDLGLGLPSDALATNKLKTFLPDYLMWTFDRSSIKDENGTNKPLVKSKQRLVNATAMETPFDPTQPYMILVYFLILYLLIGLVIKSNILIKVLDSVLFFTTGICGWIIVFLWFVTDHNTTQWNFNLLWTFPLLFPLGLLIWKNRLGNLILKTMNGLMYINLLLLVVWYFLPQKMNPFYWWLVLLLAYRYSVYIGFWKGKPIEKYVF